MALGAALRDAGDWLELTTGEDAPIRVHKHVCARSRRLRLSVTAQGARLSCPPGISAWQIESFLQQHLGWLREKLDQLRAMLPQLPPLQAGEPTQVLLRGEPVPLYWSEGAYPRIQRGTSGLQLILPEPLAPRALPLARSLLAGFFETQLRRDVAAWLGGYVERLGRAPTALRVRSLKSLWGSLDTRDCISLDLSLALAPPDALRYVLVHELAHLKVRNHAPRFWEQVGQLYPDWREQRRWLRRHGLRLKAELERLTLPPALELG